MQTEREVEENIGRQFRGERLKLDMDVYAEGKDGKVSCFLRKVTKPPYPVWMEGAFCYSVIDRYLCQCM